MSMLGLRGGGGFRCVARREMGVGSECEDGMCLGRCMGFGKGCAVWYGLVFLMCFFCLLFGLWG
jgi:hypothetical protein